MLVQHTLNAGEKTKLKVSYKTKGMPGDFVKKVFFTLNGQDQERIEVVTIRGHVLETPSAKISVKPRSIIIEGQERNTGKKQEYEVTNEGTRPLEITRISSKDGKSVYFNGADHGNLVIEPGQTKTVEIQLEPAGGTEPVLKQIIINSNARTPDFLLIVRYK